MPTAFANSVGPSHNVFMTESFIDGLAAAAGSPTAFWRSVGPVAQCLRTESFLDEFWLLRPTGTRSNTASHSSKCRRAKTVLALAVAKAGWAEAATTIGRRYVRPARVWKLHGASRRSRSGQRRRGMGRASCARSTAASVNPDTVEAQVEERGHVWDHGALYGNITVKNGRVEEANFDSDQILRSERGAGLEVHIVQRWSARRLGEAGTSAIVPAVINAIFAATGKRLLRLPVDTAALRQPG